MRISSLKFNKAIVITFLICMSYWIYLIFSSKMAVICDAASYESLGSLIHTNGWKEYFRTGPNREPFYPLTISFSMAVADIFSLPYYYIQKIIQVIMLLFTQLSFLYLLKKLNIDKKIIVFSVAYMGLSPAIVNSAFSLFSEISALPFILPIIIIAVFIWRNLTNLKITKIIFYSILFSSLFFLAASAKGVFQYIFFIFVIPYIIMLFFDLKNNNKKHLLKRVIFVCSAMLVFNTFLISYKGLNFKYNGKFEFTDRFGELLYGNAEKRAQKLTLRMLIAHLISIPGYGITEKIIGAEEARYSGFQGADGFRAGARNLNNKECVIAVWNVCLKHPFQYIFFMVTESLRMFFWETTKLGFVSYPEWLQKIFTITFLKNSIRLAVSLLTILSFLWLLCEVISKRKIIIDFEAKDNEKAQILFFTLLLILSYTGIHSFFSIVTRYAIVITPLYILTNACFLDNLINNRRA